MTERGIQRKLWQKYDHQFVFLNMFVGIYERDWWSVTGSGYCWEIEIKCSTSDFKADFVKKETKHRMMDILNTTQHERSTSLADPNRFYFATPDGLVSEKDVPDYAGLIYVGRRVKIVKQAPVLHEDKHDIRPMLLKTYYAYRREKFRKLFPK